PRRSSAVQLNQQVTVTAPMKTQKGTMIAHGAFFAGRRPGRLPGQTGRAERPPEHCIAGNACGACGSKLPVAA
ncbi:hypothetical protein, partial [Massilia sp.]|uniref:hypothetical protein n=1 Tax=Massilia sp. TaxID=1882437 RepID=UPI0028A760AA